MIWRLWCKALGKKALDNDREADYVAGIRTIIFITYFITNLFIIAGVVRHWNDIPTERLPIQHQSIQEKHS
jgi:hypothetical protein